MRQARWTEATSSPLINSLTMARRQCVRCLGLASDPGRSPTCGSTDRSELRDGCDDLLMVIATSGDRLVSHRGREQTLGADDAVLMTTAETATKTYPSLSRLISLRVPRKDSEIGWPAAFQGATFPRVDRSILGDVRSNRGDEHVETRRQQGHRWSLVH